MISVENRKFFPPRVFCTPADGFPLELESALGVKETRMMGLPDRGRSLTISSAVWIQYTNVTDGHRATAKTALTHSISRGKNPVGNKYIAASTVHGVQVQVPTTTRPIANSALSRAHIY